MLRRGFTRLIGVADNVLSRSLNRFNLGQKQFSASLRQSAIARRPMTLVGSSVLIARQLAADKVETPVDNFDTFYKRLGKAEDQLGMIGAVKEDLPKLITHWEQLLKVTRLLHKRDLEGQAVSRFIALLSPQQAQSLAPNMKTLGDILHYVLPHDNDAKLVFLKKLGGIPYLESKINSRSDFYEVESDLPTSYRRALISSRLQKTPIVAPPVTASLRRPL